MEIGIGLPNTIPGTPGTRLLDWARRAEERGFTGLSTIDRVNYPSHDSLATHAAMAGATTRIGLLTNILLGPVYPAALLARATATIDQVSGGRFTLGIAPGGREDDYTATGVDFHSRGRVLDAQLDLLHRAWRGELVVDGDRPLGPRPVRDERVPILIGGSSDATLRRLRAYGEGWTAGGSAPDRVGPFAEQVRRVWTEAGRDGEPRIAALAYFSLGADAEDASRANLMHYYAFLGDYAGMISDSALRTEATVRDAVKMFEDAGATELYFDPTTAALDQVDRLADVVL